VQCSYRRLPHQSHGSNVDYTLQVLLRRTKHNPLLIGEAGVGKTAVVEGGIAQLMAAPSPPQG
jgi:ATP-dependent Clp protease ATP-binding subunit ClpA